MGRKIVSTLQKKIFLNSFSIYGAFSLCSCTKATNKRNKNKIQNQNKRQDKMYSSYYSSPMPSSRYLDSSNYRSSSNRFSDATSSSLGSRSYRDVYSNGTSQSSATRYRPPLPTPSYRPISTHSNNSFSTTPTSSTIKNRYFIQLPCQRKNVQVIQKRLVLFPINLRMFYNHDQTLFFLLDVLNKLFC